MADAGSRCDPPLRELLIHPVQWAGQKDPAVRAEILEGVLRILFAHASANLNEKTLHAVMRDMPDRRRLASFRWLSDVCTCLAVPVTDTFFDPLLEAIAMQRDHPSKGHTAYDAPSIRSIELGKLRPHLATYDVRRCWCFRCRGSVVGCLLDLYVLRYAAGSAKTSTLNMPRVLKRTTLNVGITIASHFLNIP